MKAKSLTVLILAATLLTSSCAGLRETNDTFTAHAESFRIFGYSIPADDQAAAREQVPSGATITTVNSTPADWTSFWGVLGNIFWFHRTEISGTK